MNIKTTIAGITFLLLAQTPFANAEVPDFLKAGNVTESDWFSNAPPHSVAKFSCDPTPVSVTIEAPFGGHVAVDAMISAHYNGVFADLHLSAAPNVCDASVGSLVTLLDNGVGYYHQSVARRVFAVSPGTHTFYLNAVKFNDNQFDIVRVNLRAIYIP